MDSLAQQAIEEALRGNWKKAVTLNREILKAEAKNKEALNRLARAYCQLGKFQKAITNYKKVLKIDPYNTIAQKALARLKEVQVKPNLSKSKQQSTPPTLYTHSFLEEPGKTKTVSLIHLGGKDVISSLGTGQPVNLIPHAHRVSVETAENEFIGRLPDDLSRRLIKLIRAGNVYNTLIRSVKPDGVRVFIREAKRAESVGSTPSFPINEKAIYASFTPQPELIHEEREV